MPILFNEHYLYIFLLCAAIEVVLITGCRPKEAAYVVYHASVTKSRSKSTVDGITENTYKLFCPRAFTKTKLDYSWQVRYDDKRMNQISDILGLTSFKDAAHLLRAVEYWFNKIVKDAKLPRPPAGAQWTLRSARCLHATEWYRLTLQHQIMHYQKPPNPLHHVCERTSLRYYAVKDENHWGIAHQRCREKWPEKYAELAAAQGLGGPSSYEVTVADHHEPEAAALEEAGDGHSDGSAVSMTDIDMLPTFGHGENGVEARATPDTGNNMLLDHQDSASTLEPPQIFTRRQAKRSQNRGSLAIKKR